MKVYGDKIQRVEVEVNPIDVLIGVHNLWKFKHGMDSKAILNIETGKWVREEYVGHGEYVDVVIREATDIEIEEQKAFKVVSDFILEMV